MDFVLFIWWMKIAETACKLGILLIADEVYDHFAFGDKPFVSMAEFAEIVPVIVLGAISKRWFVPGWRLGWMVTLDPHGIMKDSGVCLLTIKLHFVHLINIFSRMYL